MDFKKRMAEEIEEMLRHKYIESEKAGRDLGDECLAKWPSEHGEAWRIGFNQRNMMDLGDGKKPVYFGAFLNDDSKILLLDKFGDYIPDGWRTICHHCTLSFGDPSDNREVFDYIATFLGKTVEFEIVSIGISDDAIALGVAGNIKSKNAIPHITLAIPPGGKPVNSNLIEDWRDIEEHLAVCGVVDSYPSHFGWQH
jgi:hypothetical protein